MFDVIVPAFNAADTLEACLHGLLQADVDKSRIIVCDDGSDDNTVQIARSMSVRVIVCNQRTGAAAARNRGISASQAETVVFVDSDVVVAPDAITRLHALLERSPTASAVFGAYDDAPTDPHIVSRYRNLLHHYTHLEGAGVAHTFWTGLGAVRRAAAISIGGFDETLQAMEDVDFGMRLSRAGHEIILEPDIQGKHLKRWKFWSMIRTDILHRALPWSRLLLRGGTVEDELNLKVRHRLGVFFSCLGCALMLFGLAAPVFLLLGLGCFALSLWQNIDFYKYLARKKGIAFAVATAPFQIIYYLCAAIGLSLAIVEALFVRRSARAAATRKF